MLIAEMFELKSSSMIIKHTLGISISCNTFCQIFGFFEDLDSFIYAYISAEYRKYIFLNITHYKNKE